MGKKVGVKTDIVGGVQFETAWGESQNFTINNIPVVCLGDQVLPHYPFRDGHQNAVMVEASGHISINGKHVCVDGDHASCGHTLSASGAILD